MNWQSITFRLRETRKIPTYILHLTKFILVSFCLMSVLFFCIASIRYLYPVVFSQSPFSSMKSAVASVDSSFFVDLMGMELPHAYHVRPQVTFSYENSMLFIFRLLTQMNPRDPKSILASQLPGMQINQTILLRSSKAPNPSEPIDLEPSPGAIEAQLQLRDIKESVQVPSPLPAIEAETSLPYPVKPRVAFIYQTHSNESFLPELSNTKNPSQAYHDQINITLVGKRLAEQLQRHGVASLHSNRIYPHEIEGFSYRKSYQYSLETVQEAIATHPQLTYFFDIHRDSSVRDHTTIRLSGEAYAQVYFIIGGKNKNWKQNEEFANDIHERLEQQYPGLSKGIHAKSSKESNGVYNQHLSAQSVLIEIGGPYNSLAECYRTADVLAGAIAEVILNAKPVSGSE